ncbi:MAG: hypothetical protein WCA22_01480 [Candidatus Binatus sp.]
MILLILQRPILFGFDNYLFRDWGSNLVAHYLVSIGLRPNIGFGYNYGLLGLLLGGACFDFIGPTPYACQGVMLLGAILTAWALARIAAYLELPLYKLAFLAVTLPFGVHLAYPSLGHSIEAALVSNAIAEQLAGRKAMALALCAAAVFAIPKLAYFYGLILIALIVVEFKRSPRNILTQFVPAAVTAIALALVLGWVYSPSALVRTILPLHGITNYHAQRNGFFTGTSRSFYYFPGVRIGFYLGGPTGFWLVCTFWLLVNGAISLRRRLRGQLNPRDEIVFTCTALQVAFVTVMYGPPGTWIYYSYILVIGVAAIREEPLRLSHAVIGAMIVLSLVSNKSDLLELRHRYASMRATQQSFGLWASADEIREWQYVIGLVRGDRVAILTEAGAAALYAPEAEKPVALNMFPGYPVDEELSREVVMLQSAKFVLAPISSVEELEGPSYGGALRYYPELARALAGDDKFYRGKYFVVYRLSAAR